MLNMKPIRLKTKVTNLMSPFQLMSLMSHLAIAPNRNDPYTAYPKGKMCHAYDNSTHFQKNQTSLETRILVTNLLFRDFAK